MFEHTPFRMKVRRLFARNGGGDFGQDMLEQFALMEQCQSAGGVRRGEEFDEFVANPLGADGFDFRGGGFQRGERLRLDLEIQLRGETNGAQQAQVVFGEAFVRRADGADDFRAQVRLASNPVMQLPRDGISETCYSVAGASMAFCNSHMEWTPQSKYVYGYETSKDDSRTQIQF